MLPLKERLIQAIENYGDIPVGELEEVQRLAYDSTDQEIVRLKWRLNFAAKEFWESHKTELEDQSELVKNSFQEVILVEEALAEIAEQKIELKSRLPAEIRDEIDELDYIQFHYYRKGFERAIAFCQKVVYATCKFTPDDFHKVDSLQIEKGYKQTAALDEVAKERGFNRESFEKQYRKRHLNKKGKGSSP